MNRRSSLAIMGLLGSGAVSWGFDRHRVKSKPECRLPEGYDYGNRPTSRVSHATSTVAGILLPRLDPATGVQHGSPVTKFYQMETTRLSVDQCAISNVALVIDQLGGWRLSLRADQNRLDPNRPGRVETVVDPATGIEKQTIQILRNLFLVNVCGLGVYNDPIKHPLNIGKPILCQLPAMEFWVQRFRPLMFVKASSDVGQMASPTIRQFFDAIDRFELQFSYR